MTPTLKTVALPNGVDLQYAERGRRDGIPVVLLHGITDSWRSFEPVLAHLPDSLHAFSVTQRGHGDASRPASGYRIEDFAGDVGLFMDAVGLEAAVVVGHSMGSVIAQRFAIDRPERVRALVLIGAVATLQGNAPVQELWDAAVSTLADPIDRGFVFDFQRSTIAQAVPPDFLEAVVDDSLKVPARVWRAAFAALLEGDLTPALGRITAPTLVLWGDGDVIASASQQARLAKGITGAELRIYAGAGHAPHWEEPERVAADIGVFAGVLREAA